MSTSKDCRKLVVGLGEVLWDVYPDRALFGGAPANFAVHASYLGADGRIVSAVGTDSLGDDALRWLTDNQQSTDAISIDPVHPTGNVQVQLDEKGSPTYHFAPDVAWDYLVFSQPTFELASRCDAICFGSLAQRTAMSAIAIGQLLDVTKPSAVRVFDVNLRQNFYSRHVLESSMRRASILKLNHDELPVVLEILELPWLHKQSSISNRGANAFALPSMMKEYPFACERLAEHYDLATIALTLGSMGSMVYHRGEWDFQPSVSVQAVDTVGAGDAFSAALVMGLLHSEPLTKIHKRASEIAAFVCTQRGAVPLPPEPLRS
jgi:fructokinase